MVVGVVVVLLAWGLYAREEIGPLGMDFEHLGCSGEWPYEQGTDAKITPSVRDGKPSFLVRDPVDCGLKVDRPSAALTGSTLELGYELHADGPVAACLCEYQSRYTFSKLPGEVSLVRFSHRERR